MAIKDLKITESDDNLKRVYVLPKQILWAGDGVYNQERLLTSKITQSFVGITDVTKISNENGHRGAMLVDFGSELVGSIQIITGGRISDTSGVKVHICLGESVSEAMSKIPQKGSTNDHAIRDMHILLTAWNRETHAHNGFRFAYIELEDKDAWIEIATIRAIFTYRDIPYLGSFRCDDERLNAIYDTCAYTVHLNMQDMIWDGIKRDRLVWSGDMYPEMLAIRTVFGDCDIIDKSIKFVMDTSPLNKGPNRITTYMFWTLLLLRDWYRYNGRTDLIIDTKDYWTAMVEQSFTLIHESGEKILDESEFKNGFFIDWPSYNKTETEAGVYALFRLALLAACELCDLVGNEKLKNKCVYYAEVLKKGTRVHNNNKQIVALLEKAGMISRKEAGISLAGNDCKGISTFTMYEILSAKAETMGVENALQMLRSYYGGMLDAGATTFWEHFDLDWICDGARIDTLLAPGQYDIHGDNGDHCYKGLRLSLCHGWSAAPAAFLAEYVLGIRILEPGCKKLLINPDIGSLHWVCGAYPTPYGIVRVEVKKEGNQIITEIDAPEEIEIVSI